MKEEEVKFYLWKRGKLFVDKLDSNTLKLELWFSKSQSSSKSKLYVARVWMDDIGRWLKDFNSLISYT